MRYRLYCEGVYVDSSGNALTLVDRHWAAIKAGWNRGWILEDIAPDAGQHAAVWTVHWSEPYNGVELAPLVR